MKQFEQKLKVKWSWEQAYIYVSKNITSNKKVKERLRTWLSAE
jgi:hypothetical protein